MTDFRYEPVPSGLMNESLAARIHDPLWFLSRQWQLGEFHGDDAGSPARMRVLGTSAPIGAYSVGGGRWQKYDPRETPLEPLVETADDRADARLRIEAGAHFVRLLRSRDLLQYRDALVEACSFARPDDHSADPLLASVAAGVPDGDRLANELDALVEGRATEVRVEGEHKAAMTAAAKEWLAWFDGERGRSISAIGDAWDPHRFEHRVRLAASTRAGGVVFSAGDYAGETLGWSEFDVDPGGRLPSFQLPPAAPVDLALTPTPVRFGGMPSPRYWEFEDARFDFGNVDAAGHDLGRLLLVQFATLFGNDWCLVPVPLDVGTVTALDHVIVTDVFGRSFAMSPAGEAQWDLFSHYAPASHVERGGEGVPERHLAGAALLLPPTLGGTLDSEALELVHLLRDEMANLAWGVERYHESPLGARVDRHAAWLAGRIAPTDDPSEAPRYIVATEVPDYWIPLVPRQLSDRRSVRLVVTPLAVPSGRGFRAAGPKGHLLNGPGDEPLWVYEEEVPRAGISVERVWKYARWHDGRSFLWKARRKRIGRGEGSSGLRFDVIVPE
jgi:hypothetical protein